MRTVQSSGIYDLTVVNEDKGVEKTSETITKAIRAFRHEEQKELFQNGVTRND